MSESQLTKQNRFIDKAVKKHGPDAYKYHLVEYTDPFTKVAIFCNHCNTVFYQTPSHHLRGCGCPTLGSERAKEKLTSSTEEFVRKATELNGDLYDYSKVIYVRAIDKVEIICNRCKGTFYMTPHNLLGGGHCPKCSKEDADAKKCLTTEEFISKSSEGHKSLEDGNPLYDYSKVHYVDNDTKVTLICNRCHLEFEQRPRSHLRGSGCPRCARRESSESQGGGGEAFAIRGALAHDGFYTYECVVYKNRRDPVRITCPRHGIFEQAPCAHLDGSRCPECGPFNGSLLERQVRDYIRSLGFETEKRRYDKKELDIVVIGTNLAIEFNGSYWHSTECGKDEFYHLEKTKLANKHGLRLIHVFEYDWTRKPEVIKSCLRHALGLNHTKVFARKCSLVEVDNSTARGFCEEHHIQGFRGGKVKLGLEISGNLVALAIFSERDFRYKGELVKGGWELIRYCTSESVVGGLSKLVSALPRVRPEAQYLLSYCALSYGTGNSYYKAGFELDGLTRPGYVWVRNDRVFSRESTQKHKLEDFLKVYDPALTEDENCMMNNMFKIYDCGNQRWIKKLR